MHVLFPLALTVAPVASAYNWGVGPPGSNFNYHICTPDFTANEETQIELGGDAWDAGAGEVLRGADVNVFPDSDRTSCSLGNGNDEVYMRDSTWMGNHFCGGFIACTLPGILAPDTDIIFNSDETWCNDNPAACSDLSMGQTMAHEMGHKIGFQHEDDNIATMNSIYPFGGDLSGVQYRIHEDDSVGLQDHKGDSSTGKNLMLARFQFQGGLALEKWGGSGWEWDLSLDDFTGTDPSAILAVIEGTSSQQPLIEWRVEVSSATACFDGVGTEYVVGTASPNLSAGLPLSLGPTSGWDFTGVPTGTYKLCAKIDADAQITETAENDNKLRSEVTLEVVP